MKLWLDDTRPLPPDFDFHARSVESAQMMILSAEELGDPIELLSLDHDLGFYAKYGGDGIKLLDWLVERETFYPVELHTANPVGKENMQRLINRYWPKEEERKIIL